MLNKKKDIEKDYKVFMDFNKTRNMGNVFTLVHSEWCLKNLYDLPNQIHLIDNLNYTLKDAVALTREAEFRLLPRKAAGSPLRH